MLKPIDINDPVAFKNKKESIKELFKALKNEPIDHIINICKIIDESKTEKEFTDRSVLYFDKIFHVRT